LLPLIAEALTAKKNGLENYKEGIFSQNWGYIALVITITEKNLVREPV
jgi:hypothetical protein